MKSYLSDKRIDNNNKKQMDNNDDHQFDNIDNDCHHNHKKYISD